MATASMLLETHRFIISQGQPNTEPASTSGAGNPSRSAIQTSSAVKLLLDSSANPNCFSSKGTPLHEAVKQNCLKLVDLLIKGGANVEVCNPRGLAPLHIACGVPELHLGVVKLLLLKGADVYDFNMTRKTPLDLALWPSPAAPKCLQLLLNHRADLNARNESGATALHHVTHKSLDGPTYHIGLRLMELLLKSGAKPNIMARERQVQGPLSQCLHHFKWQLPWVTLLQSNSYSTWNPKALNRDRQRPLIRASVLDLIPWCRGNANICFAASNIVSESLRTAQGYLCSKISPLSVIHIQVYFQHISVSPCC
ncbi:ankyrin repeat-containing domain protein [Tuber brumale]|nr:ankyrin repeat-containing domain protein [Tuber brumale]